MNRRPSQHQYFSKNGFDESLDDILSFVTSPNFCKTPWTCVTISVGKNGRGKKRGIVHVHRTSLEDTNNFQIKFHRCKKKICDHDVCQKPCQTAPYIGNRSSKNIRSMNDLVPSKKKKKNRKKLKSPSSVNFTRGNDEMCVSFADSIGMSSVFENKRSSSKGEIRINGDRKRCRSKSLDGRRPSCILYVYADGNKRKVSFQLHPDMEMFLVRALDKIENYVGPHKLSGGSPSLKRYSDQGDFSEDSELNISKKIVYPPSDTSEQKHIPQRESKTSVSSQTTEIPKEPSEQMEKPKDLRDSETSYDEEPRITSDDLSEEHLRDSGVPRKSNNHNKTPNPLRLENRNKQSLNNCTKIDKCFCQKGNNTRKYSKLRNTNYNTGMSYSTDSSDNRRDIENLARYSSRKHLSEKSKLKCHCVCDKNTCPKLKRKRQLTNTGTSPEGNERLERHDNQHPHRSSTHSKLSESSAHEPHVSRSSLNKQNIVQYQSEEPIPSPTIQYYPCCCCGCERLEPKPFGKNGEETEYRIGTVQGPYTGPNNVNTELNGKYYTDSANYESYRNNRESSPEISQKMYGYEINFENRRSMTSQKSGIDDLRGPTPDYMIRARSNEHSLNGKEKIPMISRGSDPEDFKSRKQISMASQRSGTDDLYSNNYQKSNSPRPSASNSDEFIRLNSVARRQDPSDYNEQSNEHTIIYSRTANKFTHKPEIRYVNTSDFNLREIAHQKCTPTPENIFTINSLESKSSAYKDPNNYFVRYPKTEWIAKNEYKDKSIQNDEGHLRSPLRSYPTVKQAETHYYQTPITTNNTNYCKIHNAFLQDVPKHVVNAHNQTKSRIETESRRDEKNICFNSASFEDKESFPYTPCGHKNFNTRAKYINDKDQLYEREQHLFSSDNGHPSNSKRQYEAEEMSRRVQSHSRYAKPQHTDLVKDCGAQKCLRRKFQRTIRGIPQNSKSAFQERFPIENKRKMISDVSEYIISDNLGSPTDMTQSTDVIHTLCQKRGRKKYVSERKHHPSHVTKPISTPSSASLNNDTRREMDQSCLLHPSQNTHTIYYSVVQENPCCFDMTNTRENTQEQRHDGLKKDNRHESTRDHHPKKRDDKSKACCIPPVSFCVENLRECSDIFQTFSRSNSNKIDVRNSEDVNHLRPSFDTQYVGFVHNEHKSSFDTNLSLEPKNSRLSLREDNASLGKDKIPQVPNELQQCYPVEKIESNKFDKLKNQDQGISESVNEANEKHTKSPKKVLQQYNDEESGFHSKILYSKEATPGEKSSKEQFVNNISENNMPNHIECKNSDKKRPKLEETFFKGWYFRENIPPHVFNATNKTYVEDNTHERIKESKAPETKIDITLALNSSKAPTVNKPENYNILEDEAISLMDNKSGLGIPEKKQSRGKVSTMYRSKFSDKKRFNKNPLRKKINTKEEGNKPPEILRSSLESLSELLSDEESWLTDDSQSSTQQSGLDKMLALGGDTQGFFIYRSEMNPQNYFQNLNTSIFPVKRYPNSTKRPFKDFKPKGYKKDSTVNPNLPKNKRSFGNELSKGPTLSERQENISQANPEFLRHNSKFNTAAKDPVEFQQTLVMKGLCPERVNINVLSFKPDDQQVLYDSFRRSAENTNPKKRAY